MPPIQIYMRYRIEKAEKSNLARLPCDPLRRIDNNFMANK